VRLNIEVVPDAHENVKSFYNINYEHHLEGRPLRGHFMSLVNGS
jgi:hypothetical protein